MIKEFEWKDLPIIKITDKDRELARMILSGTPSGEEHKMTRGFLFHNVIEGDFVEAKHYENFMKLLKAYLGTTWPAIKDWDKALEGKTKEDLEWEPNLMAYYFYKRGMMRLPKTS